MVALCRKHGVREVAVDGAHAIGLVEGGLDVEAMGADWYFSNLHKWCFAPHTVSGVPGPGPSPNADGQP